MERRMPRAPNLSSMMETVDEGCPICKGVVKGNDKFLFYCKRCNILFRRIHLR